MDFWLSVLLWSSNGTLSLKTPHQMRRMRMVCHTWNELISQSDHLWCEILGLISQEGNGKEWKANSFLHWLGDHEWYLVAAVFYPAITYSVQRQNWDSRTSFSNLRIWSSQQGTTSIKVTHYQVSDETQGLDPGFLDIELRDQSFTLPLLHLWRLRHYYQDELWTPDLSAWTLECHFSVDQIVIFRPDQRLRLLLSIDSEDELHLDIFSDGHQFHDQLDLKGSFLPLPRFGKSAHPLWIRGHLHLFEQTKISYGSCDDHLFLYDLGDDLTLFDPTEMDDDHGNTFLVLSGHRRDHRHPEQPCSSFRLTPRTSHPLSSRSSSRLHSIYLLTSQNPGFVLYLYYLDSLFGDSDTLLLSFWIGNFEAQYYCPLESHSFPHCLLDFASLILIPLWINSSCLIILIFSSSPRWHLLYRLVLQFRINPNSITFVCSYHDSPPPTSLFTSSSKPEEHHLCDTFLFHNE